MIRFTKVVLFAVLLLPLFASAQYEDVRFPQPEDEIPLMKKNKVSLQSAYLKDSLESKLVNDRAFDTAGRLIADITFNKRAYYRYDDKGRLIETRDTLVTKDGELIPQNYRFAFGPGDYLLHVDLPDGISDFNYDQSKHVLHEQVNRHDTITKADYRFNNDHRVIEKITRDNDGNKLSTDNIVYGVSGRILNETELYYSAPEVDSIFTVYQYNTQKQLTSRMIFTWKYYYNAAHQQVASQYMIEKYLFGYDDQGRMISEDYTHSLNKFVNHHVTWKYDKSGLPVKKTIAVGKTAPQVFEYRYAFLPEKK